MLMPQNIACFREFGKKQSDIKNIVIIDKKDKSYKLQLYLQFISETAAIIEKK